MAIVDVTKFLPENHIYHGDSRTFLKRIRPESIALSVWSPPYFVGKAYEKNLSFSDWEGLLREVIKLHFPIIKPGGVPNYQYRRHFMLQRCVNAKNHGRKRIPEKNRRNQGANIRSKEKTPDLE
jgi:hypothetical protein